MNPKFFQVSQIIVFLILVLTPAFSEENKEPGKVRLGYAIDLLPTAVSAVDGKAGYSVQAWAGYDHVKVRVVAAHLYQPDSVIDSSFENYELNVAAFLIDWFPLGDLSGFWFGTGSEFWNSRIEHKGTGSETSWVDNIITAGIGYVWEITDNLYIDPFAAVHFRMNDGNVNADGEEFGRKRVSASASIKIGYQFNL